MFLDIDVTTNQENPCKKTAKEFIFWKRCRLEARFFAFSFLEHLFRLTTPNGF